MRATPSCPSRPFQNLHNFGGSLDGPIRREQDVRFFTYEGIRGVRAYPLLPPQRAHAGDAAGQFPAVSGDAEEPVSAGNVFHQQSIPSSLLSPAGAASSATPFPAPNFGGPDLTAGNYRWTANGPGGPPHLRDPDRPQLLGPPLGLPPLPVEERRLRDPGRTLLSAAEFGRHIDEYPPRQFLHRSATRYTIRPNMYNEFRAGVVILVSQSDADVKGQELLDQIGIQGLPDRRGSRACRTSTSPAITTVTQSC